MPGLLIGALQFGHLPTIFVPGGPDAVRPAQRREGRACASATRKGKVGRDALLEAETKSYHGPGTCTFYGTANSNQMLMEVMGLHLPGAAFVNPNTPLRDALTAAAAHACGRDHRAGRRVHADRPTSSTSGPSSTASSACSRRAARPITRSTWSRWRARPASLIDWDDFSDLSDVVPLLARIYPNGKADVNHFHAAGGMGFLIRELLDAGLLHEDVKTVAGDGGLACATAQEPYLDDGKLAWRDARSASGDTEVLRRRGRRSAPTAA